MKKKHPKNAFTLVELLVVIAIIAVLLSILVPTLRKAREQAKAVVCMSNLKQLGYVLQFYMMDSNNRVLPRHFDGPGSFANRLRYWPQVLTNLGHVENRDVFYCPSQKPFNFKGSVEVIRKYDPTLTDDQAWNYVQFTYGMRDWYSPADQQGTGSSVNLAKKISLITQPADFFLIADSYFNADYNPAYMWMDGNQGYSIGMGSNSSNWRIHLRHNNNAHVLMADLHVGKKQRSYFENMRRTWQVDYMTNHFLMKYRCWPNEKR
ncbi:MAG: type II secretion system protein [Planctomycetota bacterium]